MIDRRPLIVVLCGSTRFAWLYEAASILESAEGKIVLTANINFKNQAHVSILTDSGFSPEDVKEDVDELHLRKIDLADEVLILNVDGYVGESTSREIAYARSQEKLIRYWRDESQIATRAGDDAIRRIRFWKPSATIKDIKDSL